MFWLAILILGLVRGKQEEPSCASVSGNFASDQSCLSRSPTTNVCSGEVQLQNVLEAGLDERCKEEEMKKEEKSGKGEEMKEGEVKNGENGKNSGEEIKREGTEMKSGCLFLLETSTREVITSREACALESAGRNSGLHIRDGFPY